MDNEETPEVNEGEEATEGATEEVATPDAE